MNIGLMSLWNAANGPSIHAELIGREWIEMGHKLIVFSALKHPDARPTNQVDEDYVIRNFSVDKVYPVTRSTFFDPNPIFDNEYEIFIVENLERMPTQELYQIYDKIREKAKTVMIVHEGGPSKDPYYYMFEWDAIVCFDERYFNYIRNYFPEDKIHIIPYPCHPYKPGDKNKARVELDLPLDIKIIFSYGFRPNDIINILPAIKEISKKYKLKYIIFANPESDVTSLKKYSYKYDFIELKISPLPLNLLYKYLYASDALIFYRESSKYKAVLSSSICLTLGSGCPILYNECNFVEMHGDEIIKYKDIEDLKIKLDRLFREGFDVNKVINYLKNKNSRVIAGKYIKLFNDLLKK